MKCIPEASSYYATGDGRLFSDLKGELEEIDVKVDTSGYKRLGVLCNDGVRRKKLLHRLIAQTYIPNPEKLDYINHKDGDKLNNHVDNLEWCTSSYNQKHAYSTKLKRMPQGELNGRNRLTEQDVIEIYWKLYEGARNIDIRKEYDIGAGTVMCIKDRSNWNYLLKDLPDIPYKKRNKKLSADTVHWVCRKLEEGCTASQIVAISDNLILDEYKVWDIRARITFKYISKDYNW